MAHITYDRHEADGTVNPLDVAAWISLGLLLAGIGVATAIMTMA